MMPILMRNISGLLLFLWLYAPTAEAQSPRVTGAAPVVSVGLGYSYTNMAVPSSERIALNGLDAAFTLDVSPRLGARVDVGYVRASHVLNSGYHGDVLSYLAGPVLYPVRHRKLAVFAQGLLGAARVTGPVPVSGSGFLIGGYVNHFAWAVGTGVEFRVSESIGVRIGTDYLHTRYFNASAAISGQNNLRITGSFVYFFGRHSGKRH